MVTARIEFKPGHGAYFCPTASQDIIEIKFESAEALIETLKGLEGAIANCTACFENGKIVDLRSTTKLNSHA